MKPAIYMYPATCSRVTMNALEEIGLDYEVRAVNLTSNVQKSPDYLAINRKGKVPVLVIDGKPMTENAAILFHFLARRYPDAALLPRHEDPVDDNQTLADLAWCASILHPIVRQIRMPGRLTLGDPAGVRADGQAKLTVECAYISTRLDQGRWWYGEQWSILDPYIHWAYSHAAREDTFPLGDFPALVAHAARVRARPAFQRVLAKEREAIVSAGLGLDPATL